MVLESDLPNHAARAYGETGKNHAPGCGAEGLGLETSPGVFVGCTLIHASSRITRDEGFGEKPWVHCTQGCHDTGWNLTFSVSRADQLHKEALEGDETGLAAGEDSREPRSPHRTTGLHYELN